MFGFSRGAFTAKFLARMIHTVGLLCKGNEEMVPFAYRLYQRHLAGEIQQYGGKGGRRNSTFPIPAPNPTPEVSSPPLIPNIDTAPAVSENGTTNGNGNGVSQNGGGATQHSYVSIPEHHHDDTNDEIAAFSNTFCRKERVLHNGTHWEERNIKVYFLGMWDCVNSVAVLEQKTPKPVPVTGTATYVRHAVAVDERRVKFKAALLAQDIRASSGVDNDEDIKEVWFPGCHGDVGGGWPASTDNPLDTQDRMTAWQRIRNLWTTRKAKKPSKYLDSGPFQMSDIPLAWMIRELELIGKQRPEAAVKWRGELLERFKLRFQRKKKQALSGFIHDSLRFGYGTGFSTVLLWKFLGSCRPRFTVIAMALLTIAGKNTEWFPFITRWELDGNEWVNVRFPLNKGATRDIPPDAVLHESLVWRLKNDVTYHPKNNHGGRSTPCLKQDNVVADIFALQETNPDPDHQVYTFSG